MSERSSSARFLGRPQALPSGFKVARHDFVNAVMAVDRHGEPVAFALKASCMDDGSYTQDVVERSETEPAATAELQAEILGMAVRGADQEVEDLGAEEGFSIPDRIVGFPAGVP